MPTKYDLLLQGGEVIDPSQSLHGMRDVAFRDGKVVALEKDISSDDAREVVDVSGKIVTPGLIDIHGHYFEHIVPFATAADRVCLPNGVTTTVDAGSSGWLHFEGFKEFILKREQTRLMALVNLSALGMMAPRRSIGEDFGPTIGISGGPQTLLDPRNVGELQDLRYAQVEEAAQCIRDNPNVVLGVKIRIDHEISGEANTIPALERARTVADMTGSFVMVHVARVPIPLAKVFEYLRPGDIVTHIFHSAENNVLDERGNVRTEVREAKEKGIVLDIGAARRNFDVQISRAAIEQGLLPTTLSSDITKTRPQSPVVYNLPEVMTLYMSMGMSLEEVIAATTLNASSAIGQTEVLGTLAVGAVGDATVIELQEGNFAYDDGNEGAVNADKRIAPYMTIKDGEVWRPGQD